MKPTIKEVAKQAKVSITTVSRVINNVEGCTNEETRNRILKVIEELDYKPNALARSLVTKKTKTIGLILPDISNPFFPGIAKGVEDRASKYDYNVILCNSYDSLKKEDYYINVLREKYVDGIILSSSKLNKDDENNYSKDIPMVFIDRRPDVNITNGVFINNFSGAYTAVKHLIDLGHRNIGCLIGPQNINTSIERLDGYKKALEDSSISINEDFIKFEEYSIEGGYSAAREILKDKKITAIFANNDLMAIGVYRAAKEMGYKIPGDISVVGFDDIDTAKVVEPPLTTVKQPTKVLGESAVEMLMEAINGKIEEKIIYLDTELIIRESTSKAQE